ncbi:MAG: alpha-glucan family phosphorylase [Bacteroidales bacterium]|jgi:phosphorylase/glycogen(starch) synthase|nr:alpha-glucan family phosphorylase [Bacteroidales bacterium]MDY0370409.1 alpha-glucan family phosphorylase [Bacteroidales bacterium]
MRKPSYVFEVSWEVSNMVGGIYTVLSSKANVMRKTWGDNYITIGPDVWMETRTNPYFTEDTTLFEQWKQKLANQGFKVRIGRWNIPARPIAILIDFTPLLSEKDRIFADLWETYKLDSIHGQWDYIEPAMFGYASGKLIESFYNFFLTGYDDVLAHYHEWMTGTGILYLKQHCPQIATVFTTHATFLGRSLAGNNLPFYKDLEAYNPSAMANRFNITAQQSLESLSAQQTDAFTTVSQITAKECKQFLGRQPDVITNNGFDDEFSGTIEQQASKRNAAREKILSVASKLYGSTLNDDTILILNSGRYEFKNKGIDLYIDALAQLNNDKNLKKDILAVIAVPANSSGPNLKLQQCLSDDECQAAYPDNIASHHLHDADHDPVLVRLKEKGLINGKGNRIKMMYVPVYLNGNDGIFDLKYYDFLAGFDLTVFPSYYEPWGYTPLESIAFGIPTITTDLAGFGLWVQSLQLKTKAVQVIPRQEDIHEKAVDELTKAINTFIHLNPTELQQCVSDARNIASKAQWTELISNYFEAWDMALSKLEQRESVFVAQKTAETLRTITLSKQDQPTWKKILFQPVYTQELNKLHEMAQNLWWSWNTDAISLFESIDAEAWEKHEQNPIALMEELTSEQMEALENDEEFIAQLNMVYTKFQDYMTAEVAADDLIAYFSMEYGLHKSLKIYSGGLGVLAGDYLKEASDSRVNLIAMGLLYRYGYFQQDISLIGDQLAQYIPQKFTHLPLEPVRDADGNWVIVRIAFPGRVVTAKAWKVKIGRISLFLLDTDIEENSMEDRRITHQLYGGDSEMRFKQEMILGIGGIRLLKKLNINPVIYHSNEGHSAFIGLERLRMLIEKKQLNFSQAQEVVRASTLFTTHTPVPAGHDAFEEHVLRTYMPHYAERLNISWEEFVGLGRFHPNDPNEKFSMSVLAANLSQEVNGVSQIHGRVSREMFQQLYPGYFANELHISHVTNGVHYFTWTNRLFQELYENNFPKSFLTDQSNPAHWEQIHQIDSAAIWSIRRQLKKELISYLKNKIRNDLTKRQESPKLILKTIDALNDHALIIGFARRFATYKRAHLLFSNLERLSELVNKTDRQLIFLFAGKAHPNDKAGQDLIKRIIEISKTPPFIGKIVFVENYDMELGHKLTSSCDIWLNTPTRPLEASGTSGEKAVMNGVLNFSVLDGWWAEGYKPNAGWAIEEQRMYQNQSFQDELDAETIYTLLETEIIPAFFDRNSEGIPEKWIGFIRNNIAQIAPHFTMKRMLDDYFEKFYHKLAARTKALVDNHYEKAISLTAWKQKVSAAWEHIEVASIKVPDPTIRPLNFGENFVAEITLKTPGLLPGDICIELMFGRKLFDKIDEIVFVERMSIIGSGEDWVQYHVNVAVNRAGVYDYTFRISPQHAELPHRQDFPLVKWI